MEIINEANEKLRDKQDEVCGFLFDLLRQINTLENDIFTRDRALEAKKPELGISPNQIAPGQKELWAEYRRRLGDIVRPACTEKLIGKGYGGSFGMPVKYGYIDGECTVNFIMKTAKRAVIETHFMQGIGSKHKFVVRDIDGKWFVDEVYYGFESDGNKWHSDNIR